MGSEWETKKGNKESLGGRMGVGEQKSGKEKREGCIGKWRKRI